VLLPGRGGDPPGLVLPVPGGAQQAARGQAAGGRGAGLGRDRARGRGGARRAECARRRGGLLRPAVLSTAGWARSGWSRGSGRTASRGSRHAVARGVELMTLATSARVTAQCAKLLNRNAKDVTRKMAFLHTVCKVLIMARLLVVFLVPAAAAAPPPLPRCWPESAAPTVPTTKRVAKHLPHTHDHSEPLSHRRVRSSSPEQNISKKNQ
jgi:hypothetical protein